jgi:hypothetical protein
MGRVKSRLARDIGRVAAWQFYRTNLQNIIRKLSRKPGQDTTWKTWLALTPDTDHLPHDLTALDIPDVAVVKQGGGNLGQRMGRIMQNMPPGPVIIIGTDIPTITASHITAGFKALGSADSVMGPATDGGYWLIGMKRQPKNQLNAARQVFARVRWSSPHALRDTLDNLLNLGLHTAMLDHLEDVDELASYDRWKAINAP